MGEFKKLDLIQKEKEYIDREKNLRTYDGKADDHPFFDDITDDDVSEFEDIDVDDDLFND